MKLKLLNRKAKEPNNSPQAAITSLGPAVSKKSFPLGLKVLYEPDDAVADIVFVHGLTGDREKTWKAAGAIDPWPKTLLPEDIDSARILTFGYDAYIADWRGMVSKNRIGNHSANLLTTLATHREKDNTTSLPIFFVAHSLGGLVWSRNSAENDLQSILECTHGIIFLGTPHSGSGLATLAELLARSIGLIKQSNSEILGILKTESEVLARIQNDFFNMIRARGESSNNRSIKLTCYYEELPLPGIGEVVPMHSAILPGYRYIGIHHNHMEMVRFENKDDPGYVSISGELRRWMKELKPNIAPTDKKSQIHFLVPFERDPHFIGRENVIAQLQYSFESGPRVALAGIGGVGKSQIAIEFCYRFRERHPGAHVLWAHAGSLPKFDQSYNEIANKLSISGLENPKNNVLQLVSEWLSDENNGMWLMIIDNADDNDIFFGAKSSDLGSQAEPPAPIFDYLPKASTGFMLVTTRDARLGQRLAHGDIPIEILPFEIGDAENLLHHKLPQDRIPDYMITAEVVEKLDYLPLAITQAAAFIKENSITMAEYRDILQTSDQDLTDLLSENIPDPRRNLDVPNSVILTWKISFDQIKKQKPRAAELISLMTLLDRQGIPKSLLCRKTERKTEFVTAIGTLEAFSLVKAEKGRETFAMHRLVQLSTRKWLTFVDSSEKFEAEAMEMLSSEFPPGRFENWTTCKTFLPHARVVLEYNYTSSSSLLYQARLLSSVAWYELEQGNYHNAYIHSLKAYGTRRSLIHDEHDETLESLRVVAFSLQKLDRYDEAEAEFRKILALRQKTHGKEHPGSLFVMSDLAAVLQQRGQYKEAETMNREHLILIEKVQGKEHPDTLSSMNNLAALLHTISQYDESETLYRELLILNEKVRGENHPETLTSMHNLACLLLTKGQYKEAEIRFLQVLKLFENLLGKEHPITLDSMAGLASALESQGQSVEAESMCRKSLLLREKVLGSEHSDTLIMKNNLAMILQEKGQYEEAEVMFRQVLASREKVLGKDHSNTLISMSHLAIFLDNQNRNQEEAEVMLRQVLASREKVLGKDHPNTLISMSHLAIFLDNQNRNQEEAEAMYRQVLASRERLLGKEHPKTLKSMENLKSFLENLQSGSTSPPGNDAELEEVTLQ